MEEGVEPGQGVGWGGVGRRKGEEWAGGRRRGKEKARGVEGNKGRRRKNRGRREEGGARKETGAGGKGGGWVDREGQLPGTSGYDEPYQKFA